MRATSKSKQPNVNHFEQFNAASNPVFRGLIFCVPNFGIVSPTSLYNFVKPSETLSYEHATVFSWSLDATASDFGFIRGGGASAPTTQYLMPDVNGLLSATKEVTLSILLKTTAATDVSGENFGVDFRNGAGSNQHYPYVDNNIYLGTFGTTRWLSAAPMLVSTMTPHMATITFRNGEQAFYQNRDLVGTGTLAENPAITYDGTYNGIGGIAAATRIYALWLWNRILSKKEIANFCDMPWFAPKPQRYVYFAQPSVAGPSNHRVIGGGWGGRVISYPEVSAA